MTVKDPSALVALDEIADGDLHSIWDISESGAEKMKKFTTAELKSALTSMDPSAFGNWVLVKEYTLDNETLSSEAIAIDGEETPLVKLVANIEDGGGSFRPNNDSGNNYGQGSITQDGTSLTSAANTATDGFKFGCGVGESCMDELIISLKNDGFPRFCRRESTRYNSSNTDRMILKYGYYWNNTADDIISFQIACGTATGKIRVYKWQEVVPIELHSYELVKEYDLSNETLNDTIDWDGEADPEIRIVVDLDHAGTANMTLEINGDTGTNYEFGQVDQNGTSVTAAQNSLAAIHLGVASAGRCYAITEGMLKNLGSRRLFHQRRSQIIDSDTDRVLTYNAWRWNNTADDITSLTFDVDGASTGTIRVYRLAKTHLFNQTIYNDKTLYVTTTGSDVTGDGTSQNPFATINGAFAWLKNKTINTDVDITIDIADGTYSATEDMEFRHSCKRIKIVGNSTTPASVTINCATGVNGIIVKGNSFLWIDGLKLAGNAKAEAKVGISAHSGSCVYVANCTVDEFGAGFQAIFGGMMLVLSSGNTANNCASGVSAYEMGRISVRGGNVTNNTSYGLDAAKRGDIYYESLTMSGNGANTNTATGGEITAG